MNDFGSYSNNSKRFLLLIICAICFLFYQTINEFGSSSSFDYRLFASKRFDTLDKDSHGINNNKQQEENSANTVTGKAKVQPTEAPKILLWTDLYGDSKWRNTVEKLLPCGAFVTRQRKYLSSAKIIIFHWRSTDDKHLPPKKLHQKWIWFHSESPHHTWRANIMSRLQKKFDCWASYRKDSDFYVPYGIVEPVNQSNVNVSIKTIKLSSKPKSIGWMVSNCKPPSGRDVYVNELRKHISVDIYGSCGKLNCSRPHDFQNEGCWQKMSDEYKFYLAFENSICTDYFTEKIINPLKYAIIPIVFGGASYFSFLPDHSFIDALSYSSPKELASYLDYLSNNETAYNEYFKWKKDYRVKLIIPNHYDEVFCQIFSELTGPNPKQCELNKGQNINKWWYGGGNCKKWKPTGLIDFHAY